MLLDVRVYRVRAGKSKVFDSIAREETIPLAVSFGHRIVAFGQSQEDPETFYLVRSFASSSERSRLLEALYSSGVWLREYDAVVNQLVETYLVAVIPVDSSESGWPP